MYIDSLFKNPANCVAISPFADGSGDVIEGTYANGKLIVIRYVYDNKIKKYEIHYDGKGKVISDSVLYYSHEGKLQRAEYYKNNKLTAFREYNVKTGKLTSELKTLDNVVTYTSYDYLTGQVVKQTVTTPDSCDYIYNVPMQGNLSSIESLKRGRRHGIYMEFNSNGTVRLIETYVSGKRNGWCMYYTNTGEFKQRDLYENGILVTSEK
jgi:antitoxin component YwqK of YwqJK toxin-antitoxin module